MDRNKITKEDIKYRQGRRKEQVEGHAIMALISVTGIMVILSVLIFLSN